MSIENGLNAPLSKLLLKYLQIPSRNYSNDSKLILHLLIEYFPLHMQNIKQIIKNRIKPELLDPVTDKGDDLKFLEEGRSHLNDQRAEVEFQQKFDK